MLPYSLGSAFVSAASGQVVTRTGKWRPTMWFSWVVIVLGYGLMIQLDEKSNVYVQFNSTASSCIRLMCSYDSVRRRYYTFWSQHLVLAVCSRYVLTDCAVLNVR